jgi:3-dehydroquinate dehydratase I
MDLGQGIGVGVFGIHRGQLSGYEDTLRERDSLNISVINIRCLDSITNGDIPDDIYDFEFLFSRKRSIQRDFVRFLSFVLGQTHHTAHIGNSSRSAYLELPFPDVNMVLPNLEIMSIGVDALELRVDLLRDSLDDSRSVKIPKIEYVAQQVMTLRKQTELPLMLTIRKQRCAGR